MSKKLGPDDDEFEMDSPEQSSDEAVKPVPLATTADQPMPALREVTARILELGNDAGKSSENEDASPETVVVIQDPEGLAPKQVALSPWAYAMAVLFDGKRSATQVIDAFKEKYGQPIPLQHVLELQRELDEALLLYSQSFDETIRKQVTDFLSAEVRPSAHAGTAYPTDPVALRTTLDGFFTAPDGPGTPALLNGDASTASTVDDTIRALMLPHIDLRQGGATYAHGYSELLQHSKAEIFFILGVAHKNDGSGLFYVSTKDHATPFGVVKANKEIAARLQEASDVEPTIAELVHRTEHSIEFQTLFLSYLLEERLKRKVEIVPILCGSVAPFLAQDINPLQSDIFLAFANALQKELLAATKPWCVISSVDLSHVGPEFEHSTMITERLLLPVERGDRRALSAIERLDISGFYNEIARTQDSRNIDAVMSMLLLLKSCQGVLKSAKLLHYDQMLKEGTHSAVSYASMCFEQPMHRTSASKS